MYIHILINLAARGKYWARGNIGFVFLLNFYWLPHLGGWMGGTGRTDIARDESRGQQRLLSVADLKPDVLSQPPDSLRPSCSTQPSVLSESKQHDDMTAHCSLTHWASFSNSPSLLCSSSSGTASWYIMQINYVNISTFTVRMST